MVKGWSNSNCQKSVSEIQEQNTVFFLLFTEPSSHTGSFPLDFLCKEFGYPAAHLVYRKFKKATGLTPMMYLKIYRLELARRKIKNQEISIGNIAAECGFSDANYFIKCFKAHFGVAPSHYKTEKQ